METVPCDLCGSTEHKVLFEQTDLLHKVTEHYFNHFSKAIKLQEFLDAASKLNMGNDMTFCLTKE